MIGTYYRLSLADEDVGADKAESNSIQGQRGLVEGHIMARPELAAERYEVLIEQMSQQEGISEKLKEENQMEWVRRMSNLENRAAEIVKTELIYTFERR